MKIKLTAAARRELQEQKRNKPPAEPVIKAPKVKAELPVLQLVPIIEWHDAYSESWRGQIVDAAFAHPAKASRALLVKIYDYLFEIGALKVGSVILDPFSGIGTTAIEGSWRDCHCVGVELEEKFHLLALENLELHRRGWEAMQRPMPTLLQGDSRKLLALVGGSDAIVSSPPYIDTPIVGPNSGATSGGIGKQYRLGNRPKGAAHDADAGYGITDGQLGALKEGSIEAIISSPPYAEIASGAGGLNTKPGDPHQQSGRSADSPSQNTDQRYGDSVGQLAKLEKGEVDVVLTSPPYADQPIQGGGGNIYGADAEYDKTGVWRKGDLAATGRLGRMVGYQQSGETSGQLGAMKAEDVSVILTSPPYANSVNSEKNGIDFSKIAPGVSHGGPHANGKQPFEYGSTTGQLGAMPDDDVTGVLEKDTAPDTFWSASSTIISQCFEILRPGGTAVWIVKSFVRKGQIVDFPNDWRRLCEHCGFETVTEIHAMLVKETMHTDLFGEEITTKKEKKSFFRRIAERKGSPEINFEVVYIMKRP